MRSLFSLFLLAAAWQDFKSRNIKLWLYLCFGVVGTCANLLALTGVFKGPNQGWLWIAVSAVPGLFLLFLAKASRGQIGAGDGWFFVVAALFLGLWKTLALLFYGLLFCSLCSLGMVTWGMFHGVSVRKKRLPFLPFLIPAWLWIALW